MRLQHNEHRGNNMITKIHELNINGTKMVAQGFNEHISGPIFIFIHGIGASINFWTTAMNEPFKSHFRWYALSLPGHYPSQMAEGFRKEDLTAESFTHLMVESVRQLIGGQPAILFGHSTGAFAALAIAAQAPELVSGVISVSGFAQGKWTGILGFSQWINRMGPLFRLMARLSWKMTTMNYHIYRWCGRFYVADWNAHSNHPINDTQRILQKDAFRHDTRTLSAYFNRMPEIDITRWLSKVSAPTLVIVGDKDPIVPTEQSKIIAARVQKGELVVLDGVGHLPMSERSAEYDRAITQWMEKTFSELQRLQTA